MCGYNPGTCDFSEKDIGLRTDYADPRWIQPSKNMHIPWADIAFIAARSSGS
jgi:hypothetical protein